MPVTETNYFFKKKRTAAEIKSEILLSCFKTWYSFYLHPQNLKISNLQYLDLLAGSGNPEDISPVTVLQTVSATNENLPELNEKLKTYFYSAAKGASEKLKADLENQPFYAALNNEPVYLPASDPGVTFPESSATLVAADPFATVYALDKLEQALLSPHSDLWLLFNLNKLKAAVTSGNEEKEFSGLLGDRWKALKTRWQQETNLRKREQQSLEALENALLDRNYNCVTLRINLPEKDQLHFYLLVASKKKELYFQFREILEPYSDYQPDGVPLFQVNQRPQPVELPGFFRYLHPYCLENLVEELANSRSRFHYRTIREVYEEHVLGTPYRKLNYLQAFENLKNQGLVNLVDVHNKQVKKLNESAIVFYKLHGNK
ncbi:hypothetical protein [Adhaeribacter pallidiroseus]|uniref:Three-Cys-motif partner protein TcmP n=1 Tax=Adhaeribacter pallidiroseus TaxID=2072847 RepID=A0A369QPC2_9BACT|nr:hypothetical protein [Adhaeribacter pallidiroseus]RDC64699.1 hypothetical protein AHMF7616_03315 [Adhaeribacter pallidiroseus]